MSVFLGNTLFCMLLFSDIYLHIKFVNFEDNMRRVGINLFKIPGVTVRIEPDIFSTDSLTLIV